MYVGERGALDLVDYLCNIICKVVAEDRGLPVLLMVYPNLYAVHNLTEFVMDLLVMEVQVKTLSWKIIGPLCSAQQMQNREEVSVTRSSVQSAPKK